MLTTRLRTLQMRKTSTTIMSITASFISFFCDEDSVALRLLERLQGTKARKAIKSRVATWTSRVARSSFLGAKFLAKWNITGLYY